MTTPRFSTRDLLLSTALIALGMGILAVVVRMPNKEWSVFTLVGFPLIGTGMFLPFKRPWLGWVLGCVAMVFFLPWLGVFVQ
jgi:hypothetical protein